MSEGVAGALGERGTLTGSCGVVLGTGGAASGSRHPRLVTGRPYGTGACGEISGGTLLPLWLPLGRVECWSGDKAGTALLRWLEGR